LPPESILICNSRGRQRDIIRHAASLSPSNRAFRRGSPPGSSPPTPRRTEIFSTTALSPSSAGCGTSRNNVARAAGAGRPPGSNRGPGPVVKRRRCVTVLYTRSSRNPGELIR
jgi:hypothetical protein